MQKFTAFTVILTILVVVVVSEIVVNEYLPKLETEEANANSEEVDLSESIATNILGADLKQSTEKDTTTISFGDQKIPRENPSTVSDSFEEVTIPKTTNSDANDFEDGLTANVPTYSPNVYIREEQIRSAGFNTAYLEEEPAEGNLYKSINLTDFQDLEIKKTSIRTTESPLAKVYVLKAGINTEVGDLYSLLRGRAASGLNAEVNETNEFGQNSFYLNDMSRPNVAFLTVRIGGLIYGFSYPKQYHPQIKNLIQLIEWELT